MRRTMLRRLGVIAGLVAASAGFSVMPSAAQVDGAASSPPEITAHIPWMRIPAAGPFIPPKTGSGDADFKGHGPRVDAEVALGLVDARTLAVTLAMSARETTWDNTAASGKYSQVIYQAPVDYCITRVTIAPQYVNTKFTYTDHGHAPDVFPVNDIFSYVREWSFIGDTDGSEAGTRTSMSVLAGPFDVISNPC